ncbi:MAG: hypothetical protein GX862_07315 [Leucobacter sp.]|jgi:transcriptional regulator|nr:hypothetical protein [Leucobacter sp.]
MDRKAKILELRAQGLTYREIAEQVGVSKAWVGHVVNREEFERLVAELRNKR